VLASPKSFEYEYDPTKEHNRNHTQTAERVAGGRIPDVETCEVMVSVTLVGIDVGNGFGTGYGLVAGRGRVFDGFIFIEK